MLLLPPSRIAFFGMNARTPLEELGWMKANARVTMHREDRRRPPMNDEDPCIDYYEGDVPSKDGPYPENFADTNYHGVAHDVDHYREIARRINGPIMEPFCGTGRVLLPLARDGHTVTGIDISPQMLRYFRAKLANEAGAVVERVTLVEQDVTRLQLEDRRHALCIVAFNSLFLIADFEQQVEALARIANHLAPNGLLTLDLMNPLHLDQQGDPRPRKLFTRRNPANGNCYTRFLCSGPFDERKRQRIFGWYDETHPDGLVERRSYEFVWRPVFPSEIECLLDRAGLKIHNVEGGHFQELYTDHSPRMFVTAVIKK